MQKHLHKLTPTLTRVYYTLSMDSSDIKTFWTVILFLLSILYNVYLDSKLLLLEILLTKNYHNNEMKIYSNSYFAQYQSFVCSRVKTFQTQYAFFLFSLQLSFHSHFLSAYFQCAKTLS